jgi:AcrR family transcriptional regulator
MPSSASQSTSLVEEQKLERRARILDSTRSLIRSDPTHSPSAADIARHAGVAPATVYNLVGTRDDLWTAIINDLFDRLDTIPHRDDPVEEIIGLVDDTVDHFCADSIVHRHVLATWAIVGNPFERNPIHRYRDALRACVDAGVLEPDGPISAIQTSIASGFIGALHHWTSSVIDDDTFKRTARNNAYVALASSATKGHRQHLLSTIQ